MNRNAKVSVIIPCFNQGKFIQETVFSVLNQTYQNFEIIIVNDGSTDEETNSILRNVKWSKTTIYHIENSGVSVARNFGSKHSTGIYILPLDGDDLIAPSYLELAVSILDTKKNIKVVTCKTELFGAKKGEFYLPEYSLEMLIAQNVLICTSMFRRDDFEKTQGYNPNMVLGLEDWSFWISLLGQNDCGVYKIEEVLFYYQINRKSRNSSMNTGWDHSARSGREGLVITNSTPHIFEQHVKQVIDLVENKSPEHKIIFIKSWNEWAEGNYMEPDLRWGKKYLEAFKQQIYN